MDGAIRRHVAERAGHLCEYCRLSPNDLDLPAFHVEHIIARQHGGSDELANLAYACFHCNLHKGPNIGGIDPHFGNLTPLFNPGTQFLNEHFELVEARILGRTAVGRVTAIVLGMNLDRQVRLRLAIDRESPLS